MLFPVSQAYFVVTAPITNTVRANLEQIAMNSATPSVIDGDYDFEDEEMQQGKKKRQSCKDPRTLMRWNRKLQYLDALQKS